MKLHIDYNFRTIVLILIGVSAVTLCIVGYFIGSKQQITLARSHNAALAQTLKSEIANLPTISTIKPSQTSQNLSYVATVRSEIATGIRKGTYRPRSVTFLYFLSPSYAQYSRVFNEHKKAIEPLADQLESTAKNLDSLRQFIEYMPTVDLADDLSAKEDTAERLERTKAGVEKAREFVKNSNIDNKSAIVTTLNKLAQQSLAINNENKDAWSKSVLEAQQMILVGIETGDILKTDYSTILNDVSQSYQ